MGGGRGKNQRARMAQVMGRNSPCYCGSGKKYKYCHLNIDGGRKRIIDIFTNKTYLNEVSRKITMAIHRNSNLKNQAENRVISLRQNFLKKIIDNETIHDAKLLEDYISGLEDQMESLISH